MKPKFFSLLMNSSFVSPYCLNKLFTSSSEMLLGRLPMYKRLRPENFFSVWSCGGKSNVDPPMWFSFSNKFLSAALFTPSCRSFVVCARRGFLFSNLACNMLKNKPCISRECGNLMVIYVSRELTGCLLDAEGTKLFITFCNKLSLVIDSYYT